MSPLTFAIGDIHGCLDKLRRVVTACESHAGGRPARYVFLGDYLDRGADSRGVIEFLMERQRAQPGSHRSFAALRRAFPGRDPFACCRSTPDPPVASGNRREALASG